MAEDRESSDAKAELLELEGKTEGPAEDSEAGDQDDGRAVRRVQ